MVQYNDIRLGTTKIAKIYSGTDLVYEMNPVDTVAPITTVYPDATKTYAAGTKVWLEVNEACTTYYTLDGTEPTTASAIFAEPFIFNETTTIKYFSVDLAGNTEATKTTTFNIEAAAEGWRYVRIQGYGDQTSTTTRIIEVQAMEGTINRLSNLLPISGETPNIGNVAEVTDGAIAHVSPHVLWWMGAGIPNLIYDLGAAYPIDTLTYIGYSPTWDVRQTKFKLFVSKDNVNWTNVIDYSANTIGQTESGFSFAVV